MRPNDNWPPSSPVDALECQLRHSIGRAKKKHLDIWVIAMPVAKSRDEV